MFNPQLGHKPALHKVWEALVEPTLKPQPELPCISFQFSQYSLAIGLNNRQNKFDYFFVLHSWLREPTFLPS